MWRLAPLRRTISTFTCASRQANNWHLVQTLTGYKLGMADQNLDLKQTYLYFTPKDTVSSVLETISSTSPTIDQIEATDSQSASLQSDLSIQDLCNSNEQFQLQINKHSYQIPIKTLSSKMAPEVSALHSYSNSSRQMIQCMVTQLSQEPTISREQVKENIDFILENYAQKNIQNLYSMYLQEQLKSVEDELNPLESIKNLIDRKCARAGSLRLSAGLFALLGQFVTFYYAIYQVEFLGWDLMEPVTYSVDALLFLYATYYYWRYSLDREEWDNFWTYAMYGKAYKLKAKFDFDDVRYYMLKDAQTTLKELIDTQ